MTESLKRRLDALIILCSTLLGLALTFLFFWGRPSVPFFLLPLLPSGIDRSGASPCCGIRCPLTRTHHRTWTSRSC